MADSEVWVQCAKAEAALASGVESTGDSERQRVDICFAVSRTLAVTESLEKEVSVTVRARRARSAGWGIVERPGRVSVKGIL